MNRAAIARGLVRAPTRCGGGLDGTCRHCRYLRWLRWWVGSTPMDALREGRVTVYDKHPFFDMRTGRRAGKSKAGDTGAGIVYTESGMRGGNDDDE